MNIHWKDWCWSWSSNPLATWFEERTHWKRLWCWERVKAGGEESNRGWDGWMASSTQWTWFVQTPEDSEGQESLVCCSSRSCKGLDTTERLNNSNQRVQMFSTTITSSTLVSSDQFLSRVWLFVTPWTAAHQPSLSSTVSWSLLKFMSVESVTPSNHLILCHPFFLLPSIFLSIRVFPSELAVYIRWPKYCPSNEYSGLISFKID